MSRKQTVKIFRNIRPWTRDSVFQVPGILCNNFGSICPKKFCETRPRAHDQVSFFPAVYYFRLYITSGWINLPLMHCRIEQQGTGISRNIEYFDCTKCRFSIQRSTNTKRVSRHEQVPLRSVAYFTHHKSFHVILTEFSEIYIVCHVRPFLWKTQKD